MHMRNTIMKGRIKMKKARKILAAIIVLVMVLCMIPGAAVASSEQSHKDLAREAVGEGIVLLKNNDALPLSSSNTIALFGGGQIYTASTSNGYQIGGGGSGWVNMDYTPLGPADVLINAAADGKVNVYEPLTAAYRNNVSYVPDEAMYNAAAEAADTAVMFITRFSTEGSDISTANWYLSTAEQTMLRTLSEKFDKVVVLVNAPSMMATDWSLDGNDYGIDVDALLITYMGGEMGAYGMADILLGDVNPSGKLVDTYAMDLYDYPSTDTFLESSSIVRYTEDIYVGYRYFETFAPDKVAYEFGFGLSYTTFDITTDSVTNDGENITVKATVKNTGDVAGKEVVEVYYSAPQAGEGSAKLSKSAIDLAAYKKTGLIQPGESETVEISYPISDMASFDDTGVSGHLSSYVLEAGTYDILVGSSVKKNVKAGEYVVDELVVTERDTQLCKTNLDERLTADGTYESMGSVTLVTKDEVAIIEGESFNSVYSESGIAPLRETFNANQGWIYNGTTWVKTGAGMILGNLDDGGDLDIGFKINVRDAGTYRMSFVTSNGNANYSTVEDILSVYLLMPDGTRVNSDIHFDIRSTYSARTITGYRWWNFRYETEDFQGNQYTIDLPAGEYEIVLSNNTNNNRANMNFDKFYLIPEGKDYTLQDAIDAYNYKEPQDLGLDLDATNDQGIKYLTL